MTDTDPRIAELQARIERLEGALAELLAGDLDISATALILGNDSSEVRALIQRARAALGRGE